jgi:hypothetical protein
MNQYKEEIDKHLSQYKDKLSKKEFKAVTNQYYEHLRRSETKIRLKEQIKVKKEQEFKEISKDW